MARHSSTLFKRTEDELYKCSTCGVSFERVASLDNHLERQVCSRPFSCATCGKTFTRVSILQEHERIEHLERPFLCTTCGKKFSNRRNLRRHEYLHSGEMRYACPHCDYKAARSGSLRNHVTSRHANEFPLFCSVCRKGFFFPFEVSDHMEKKHTGSQVKTTNSSI